MVIASLRGRDTGSNMYQPLRYITLTDNEPNRFLVEAYCAEFHKDNPRPRSAFNPADEIDPIYACILNGAKVKKLSTPGTQAAIWIYTDRITFSQMNDRMSITSSEWSRAYSLATACAGITHD
jgi:hypothetical protein